MMSNLSYKYRRFICQWQDDTTWPRYYPLWNLCVRRLYMRVKWAIKWPLFLHFLTVNLNTGSYWHPKATRWAIVVWKTPSTVCHSCYGCREAIPLRLYYYCFVLFTVAGDNPSLVVDCVPIQKSPDNTSKGIFLAAQGLLSLGLYLYWLREYFLVVKRTMQEVSTGKLSPCCNIPLICIIILTILKITLTITHYTHLFWLHGVYCCFRLHCFTGSVFPYCCIHVWKCFYFRFTVPCPEVLVFISYSIISL